MSAGNWTACGFLVAVCSVSTLLGYAQDYHVEHDHTHHTYYRVRVINQMGVPICTKIMPYGKSNYFHAHLSPNSSQTENLWAGQRALCVWDDRTGELLVVARVDINRNGILRIRPLWGEPAKAGAASEAPQASASPSVEIESE